MKQKGNPNMNNSAPKPRRKKKSSFPIILCISMNVLLIGGVFVAATLSQNGGGSGGGVVAKQDYKVIFRRGEGFNDFVVTVSYGSPLDLSKLPIVPDNEKGQSWIWDINYADLANITSNITVTGRFVKNNEIVVSIIDDSFGNTTDMGQIVLNSDGTIKRESMPKPREYKGYVFDDWLPNSFDLSGDVSHLTTKPIYKPTNIDVILDYNNLIPNKIEETIKPMNTKKLGDMLPTIDKTLLGKEIDGYYYWVNDANEQEIITNDSLASVDLKVKLMAKKKFSISYYLPEAGTPALVKEVPFNTIPGDHDDLSNPSDSSLVQVAGKKLVWDFDQQVISQPICRYDIKVRSHYELIDYKITFVERIDGAETGIKFNQNKKFGEFVETPYDKIKPSGEYIHKGYFDSLGTTYDFTKIVENDLTIYIDYTTNYVTFTFNNPNYIHNSFVDDKIKYGTTVTLPTEAEINAKLVPGSTNYTKEGYELVGWETYLSGIVIANRNITFTPVYAIKKYTVTFIVPGKYLTTTADYIIQFDGNKSSVSCDYGYDLTNLLNVAALNLDELTRKMEFNSTNTYKVISGFVLDGTAIGANGFVVGKSNANRELTFVATLSNKKYNISYEANGVVTDSTSKVEHGKNLGSNIAREILTNCGSLSTVKYYQTFKGVKIGPNGTTITDEATLSNETITGDTRFIAVYEDKSITIKFVMPNGKTPIGNDTSVTYGGTVTAPDTSSLIFDDGTEFDKWERALDNIIWDEGVSSITIKALSKDITYRVNFYKDVEGKEILNEVNGGTITLDITYGHSLKTDVDAVYTKYPALKNPLASDFKHPSTLVSHNFLGWGYKTANESTITKIVDVSKFVYNKNNCPLFILPIFEIKTFKVYYFGPNFDYTKRETTPDWDSQVKKAIANTGTAVAGDFQSKLDKVVHGTYLTLEKMPVVGTTVLAKDGKTYKLIKWEKALNQITEDRMAFGSWEEVLIP